MAMHSPAHPGQIVRDLIGEAGLTVGGTATRLGVSRQQLTRLIGQKSGVSAEMALRLEAVFGSTAEAWMRMQDAWELAEVRQRADEITAGLTRIEPEDEPIN
jgi:addiction module HigA family antidote